MTFRTPCRRIINVLFSSKCLEHSIYDARIWRGKCLSFLQMFLVLRASWSGVTTAFIVAAASALSCCCSTSRWSSMCARNVRSTGTSRSTLLSTAALASCVPVCCAATGTSAWFCVASTRSSGRHSFIRLKEECWCCGREEEMKQQRQNFFSYIGSTWKKKERGRKEKKKRDLHSLLSSC